MRKTVTKTKLLESLAEIPGVRPVTATALVATIGDAKLFRNGRELAAWAGRTQGAMEDVAGLPGEPLGRLPEKFRSGVGEQGALATGRLQGVGDEGGDGEIRQPDRRSASKCRNVAISAQHVTKHTGCVLFNQQKSRNCMIIL